MSLRKGARKGAPKASTCRPRGPWHLLRVPQKLVMPAIAFLDATIAGCSTAS